jgi:2-polyprenyl-3-methyl-5-hydroxy-6-metoxy-1,4-benzoquinol methylase
MTETESGAEFISEAHVRHIMRYVQARDWLKDKKRFLLDAACGTGYGSKILAKDGHAVHGIDFDEAALEEAKKSKERCIFIKQDLLKISKPQIEIQAIVSIETIEHFSEADGAILLERFRDSLEWGGILIISTPYCTHSGPSPITKQHLWEYSLTDFEQALAQAGFEIELMKLDRHEGKAGRLGYAMAKAIKR